MNSERIERLQVQTLSEALREEHMTEIPQQQSGLDSRSDLTARIDYVDERRSSIANAFVSNDGNVPNHYPQITDYEDRQMYPVNSLSFLQRRVCID
jgi:hypothetical protein